MGACYSKSGHDVDASKKKSPHSKKQKNGLSLTIEYSPVRSPNHDEDKLSIFKEEGGEGEQNVIESNGNVEGQCCSTGAKESGGVVLSVNCDVPSGEGVSSDSKVTCKVASTSDSGIESLHAQESHHSSQTLCDKSKPYQNSDEEVTLTSLKNESHEIHEPSEAEASSAPSLSESLPCSPVRQKAVSPDGVNLELISSNRTSQELRPRSIMKVRFDSEASLELTSTFPRLQEVKTMQIDGRDVVVIEVETYTHIMEELAMLKMKLSQLTDFLQEQDLLPLDSSRDGADLSSLNQSLENLMEAASPKKSE
ncbi:uncharacterized protein LOC111118836 isoform X3 [Crassostrea virginica]